MAENYGKNYRILGVPPGASWQQLRQAYKKLVNTWHPDRFQNHRQKKRAEEKTKEITQSYKELAEYHKKFGVLPFASGATEVPVSGATTPQNPPDTAPAPEIRDAEPTAAAASSKSWRSIFLTLAVLAGIAYYIWQAAPSEQYSAAPVESPDPAVDSRGNGSPDQNTSTETRFTIGSTLGEVYTIQGVPNKTENDVWYYGESRVYFSKGKVTQWKESQEHPLRVTISAGSEKPTAKFFSKGSSKEEVRALQGAPDRDAGNVWDYGLSRVYFEKDRVTRWHEVPMNPLKVRP